MCVYAPYVSGAHRIWKRALDPPRTRVTDSFEGSGVSERVASALKG